jgi:hypothetical protein
MKKAAESVIGIKDPPQRNDCFDDECAEATSLNRAYKNVSQEGYKTGEGRIPKEI